MQPETGAIDWHLYLVYNVVKINAARPCDSCADGYIKGEKNYMFSGHICDVPGIMVGNASDLDALTGVTAIY